MLFAALHMSASGTELPSRDVCYHGEVLEGKRTMSWPQNALGYGSGERLLSYGYAPEVGLTLLFFLYAIEIINNCKNSTPDHGFAIVERVKKVWSLGRKSRNWR